MGKWGPEAVPSRTGLFLENLQGRWPPCPRPPPFRPRRAACRGGGGSVPEVREGRGASRGLGAEGPHGGVPPLRPGLLFASRATGTSPSGMIQPP